MAPKRVSKCQAGTAASAAKKAKKADPTKHVLEAIGQADHLPESCRKMLRACLPLCLATPKDMRHEVQSAVVSMLGEVVEGVQAKLQAAVDAESAKLGEVESRRAELKTAVSAAEEVCATAAKSDAVKSAALTQAATSIASARGALKEKVEAQRSGDADLISARESKAALEQGLEEHLRAIVEATDENPLQHYEALAPLLKDLALEQSLLTTLPGVCAKRSAEERGAFGTMVLDRLGDSLRNRIANLAETVDKASPAAQQREAAVQEAQAVVDKASAAYGSATEELNSANASQAAAVKGLIAARSALAACELEVTQATALRDEEASKLENFKLHSVASFQTLRDAVSCEPASAGGA